MPIFHQTDPYLIFVARFALIMEVISVPGNIILFVFHYITSKNEIKRRKNNKTSKNIDKISLMLTYILLFFGFCFGICQGLIENWLINDCTVNWLAWTTFAFFISHRVSLLLIFLNRLYSVFNGTVYSYPIWYIVILGIFIVIYGVASLFIYGFDYGIIETSMGWKTLNGGEIICAWKFGKFVNFLSRPMEALLSLILLVSFLYKLFKLTNAHENQIESIPQKKAHIKLRTLFRKLTILTTIAVISSIIVTWGYILYYTRILGALFSLDVMINSLCAILMFKWNHFIIKPCCGSTCDRCFCIQCIKSDSIDLTTSVISVPSTTLTIQSPTIPSKTISSETDVLKTTNNSINVNNDSNSNITKHIELNHKDIQHIELELTNK